MKNYRLYFLLFAVVLYCGNKVDIVNLQYRSWKVLEAGVKDNDPSVRANACEALSKTGLKDSILLLAPLLNDNAGLVRFNAAVALASLHDTSGVKILKQVISKGDSINAIFAMGCFIELGEEKYINDLTNIFNNSENEIYKILAASELLQNGDKKYSEFIKSTLKHPDPLFQSLSLEVLTNSGIDIPVETLTSLESIDHPTLKIAILTYRGLKGEKDILLKLKNYLNHKEISIRNYAAGNIIRVTFKYSRGIWED
ncbi:HEAT repeat domain-containing protein [candidate division KSB1 bacterium]